MIYKVFLVLMVIAKLSHEFFGKLLQSIAPAKHGNLRFYVFILLYCLQLFGFSEQVKCSIFTYYNVRVFAGRIG